MKHEEGFKQLNIRLPWSIYLKLKEVIEKEKTSFNAKFIELAKKEVGK